MSNCDSEFDALSKLDRRSALYRAQGGRCWYCDCVMTLTPGHVSPTDYATFEHISPILRNSKTHKVRPGTPAHLKGQGNLVLACWQCNNDRGTIPLTTFISRLRQTGKVRGIVARIRHLVNDHMPGPQRASEFEWYMLQALAHPRRPGDCLKRLPASLESAVLPDPAQPVPLVRIRTKNPPPKRRAPSLVVRFFRTLWRCTRQVRRLFHRREAPCLKR